MFMSALFFPTGAHHYGPILQQHQLPFVRFTQASHPQAKQPQRPGNQLVTTQKKATQPIDVIRFRQRIFDRNLAGERGEIAVTHLHLSGMPFCARCLVGTRIWPPPEIASILMSLIVPLRILQLNRRGE